MRSFKAPIRRAFNQLGFTVIRTSAYAALRRERDELMKRAFALQAVREGEGAAIDGADHQAMMAYHIMKAGFDDLEPGFQPLMDFVKPYTMTSVERMYHLYTAARYLAQAKVAGDILECGVWRGGSMMLVAKTLLEAGDTGRTLHLFDTYEGHPKPDSKLDVDMWGNRAVDEWIDLRKTDETSDWARVSIEEVQANMASTGYPGDRVRLVKGMVEKTAAANVPEKLALLRLDTDWYASAKISLEVFWPRLAVGGVLIVDDYGHYKGQRKAVDEFFAANPQLLHRIDYSCRAIVKTR
jgi:O-methyltransferase